MASRAESIFESVRQSQYTGENRCIPCTIVNVTIGLVVAAMIAVVSIGVAVAFFVISLGVIYFRGYLVPGTPELTKRYLPQRILQYFDHHPTAEEVVVETEEESDDYEFETVKKLEYRRENKVDPEQFLLDAGAIEFIEEENDIRLTQEFIQRIDNRMEELDYDEVTNADIADLFDAEPEDVTDEGRDYPAYKVGFRIRKWPSETAFLADLAGEEVIKEYTDEWEDVPLEQRANMRETFRYLREFCPDCGGRIVFTENTVESCCGAWEVIAIKCESCGHHFVELDPTQTEEPPKPHGMTPG